MRDKVVKTLVVTATTQGTEQAAAALNKVADGQANVTRTAGAMAATTDRVEKGTRTLNGTYERMLARNDKMFRAQQALDREMAIASRLYDAAAIDLNQYNTALAAIEGNFERATAAARANGAALAIAAGAANDNIRLTKGQMQGLAYQINDIGTMFAMGASPFQIMASQGGQVIQLLGDGPGGMKGSIKAVGVEAVSLAGRFLPAAVAIGGAALAVAGLTHEINEASDVTVTFGDTAKAVMQVIGGAIYGVLQPAIQAISGWWAEEWDIFTRQTRELGNFLVKEFQGAFEIIKAGVMSLPDAFIVAGQGAANGFVKGIEWLVKTSMEKLNSLFDGLNGLLAMAEMPPITLFDPESIDFGEIEIGGTAAMERLRGGAAELGATLDGIAASDPMGELFGAVKQQTIENARERIAEAAEATAGAGGAAEKAAKQTKAHAAAMSEQEKAAQELAQSLEQTLGSTLGSLFDGPMDDMDAFFDKLVSGFAQIGQANLNSLFQGSFGGTPANDNGDWVGESGFAKVLEQSVAQGTKHGWLDGLTSLGGKNGGGGLAGLAGAGLGGFGIGAQTQNPIMGALGGALAGFATGNPLGAPVGAVCGLSNIWSDENDSD
jgi:hypothetical protein